MSPTLPSQAALASRNPWRSPSPARRASANPFRSERPAPPESAAHNPFRSERVAPPASHNPFRSNATASYGLGSRNPYRSEIAAPADAARNPFRHSPAARFAALPKLDTDLPWLNLPPPAEETVRHFGGPAALDPTLPKVVLDRLMHLTRTHFIARALENEDGGYNAFLGGLLHAIAAQPPEAASAYEKRIAGWLPDTWTFPVLVDSLFIDEAQLGQRDLLSVLQRLQKSDVLLRHGIVANFCTAPAFASAVTYLRCYTARQQILGASDVDFLATAKHVQRRTLQERQHASWGELTALAEGLGVDLAVANPRESDNFCFKTHSPSRVTVGIVSWAEGPDRVGHFDSLLPLDQVSEEERSAQTKALIALALKSRGAETHRAEKAERAEKTGETPVRVLAASDREAMENAALLARAEEYHTRRMQRRIWDTVERIDHCIAKTEAAKFGLTRAWHAAGILYEMKQLNAALNKTDSPIPPPPIQGSMTEKQFYDAVKAWRTRF